MLYAVRTYTIRNCVFDTDVMLSTIIDKMLSYRRETALQGAL